MTTREVTVTLRNFEEHPKALAFIRSKAKRKIARAGRRGAKTVAVATMDVEDFLAGHRVLYTAPTKEQTDSYWREVTLALGDVCNEGIFRKNETERFIENPKNPLNRLKAKTVWDVDSARGDYGDKLTLDEAQLMDGRAWYEVLQPVLIDHDGDARIIYTPPSLSGGFGRGSDPLWVTKLAKEAQVDITGEWEFFHWTSRDNPFVSGVAIDRMVTGMSRESYRREIEAEDDDISPNRLIYRAFNEQTCKINPFPLPETWPCYVGHDFGSANPAALFFAQDPATGYFYAYHEYFPGVGYSTYQHVQAFKELTKGVNVLKRAGGSHQEDEIRQGYSAQGWHIQEPKIRDVNAAIDRVRAMMEKNQIFVFNNLHRLLEQLMTYLWKVDADGRITDEIYNKSAFHLLDCMRGILSDFTPERAATIGGRRVSVSMAQF